MNDKVRVNSADPQELLALPGLRPEHADRIVRFRAEHGPIADESELSRVLGWRSLGPALWDRVDYTPAWDSRPEAPAA